MASNNSFTLNGSNPTGLPTKKKPIYPTPSGNPIQSTSTPSAPRVGVSSPQALQSAGLISKPVSNVQQGNNPGLIQPKPTTPLKKIITSNVDGSSSTQEFHSEAKPVKPTTPQVGTPTQNAQNVLNTGQQTPLEQSAFQNLQQAGQMTPQEMAANEEVKRANELQKSYQNVGALAPYAEASMYSDRARTPEEIQAIQQSPDLAGRASSTYGLTNSLSNIYGSSRVAGANAALQGIQTAAQRGLGAAQSGLLGAQSQATRAQSGAGTVLTAGLPTYPSYGSQVINPLTGLPMNDGASGNLQQAVSNVVSRLNDGTMTYNDAVSALSGYGQGGLNALQQALPQGFNVAQSNTLAGQQGSIGVNYQLADTALSNVENLMKELNVSQTTNVPLVNKLTQGFSTLTGLGSEQTRAVTGAVQSLRNAYASLLASAKGGTPTDYSGQALAEIPDQPTPNDIKAIRHNFEVLGKARANILGNPGQAGGTPGSQTGGSVWDF